MIRDRIPTLIDVANTRGLEIGALNQPTITRAMGPIEYIDRASREELQRWYAADPHVDIEDIVPVDHIWGEQSLKECVAGREYSYLVASHVIEHVPDLFGWLGEIAAVLGAGGLAIFAVPDKRYTFDVARRTTGGAELVEAYVRRQRQPSPRQIFDSFHYFHDPATGLDRDGETPSDKRTTDSARAMVDLLRRTEASGEYIDSHCWVFTPRSMIDALDLGSRIYAVPFEIATLEPTEAGSNEFLLVLRRLSDSLTADEQRARFVASVAALNLPQELEFGADSHALMAQAHVALARVAAMEASTSWRLTAPLRAAVTAIRSLTGRG